LLNLARRKIIVSHAPTSENSIFARSNRRHFFRTGLPARVKFLPQLCLCLLAWSVLPLHAVDLAALRVGDAASADIVTPVALDVVDAAATAALQSDRARQIPAVFRSFPDATNAMAREFLAAFAQARTNFLAEMAGEFHSTTLDATAVASPDFERLVTGFGVENRKFPVSDELAAEWARGGDGRDIREKLLAALQQTAARRVRPDALPDGMIVGDEIRLVPVAEADQKISPAAVEQSPLAPAASLTTVSDVRAQFRRGFPDGQQLFARALAAFIRPNCLPDAPFTQLSRGMAVCQLVVVNHFDAGDTLVRRGGLIDAKTRAALAALNEKLHSAPAAVAESPKPSAPAPVAARSPALNPPAPALKAGVRHKGLIVTLAGISTGALLVFAWQVSRGKKRAPGRVTAVRTTEPPPVAGDAAKAGLAPEVAHAVREAVVQELATQRRELLLAQQAATEEVATLVRRLDELQVPMQERLHAYETRIQALEKELAIRTEENRELLKAKIEMTRRQLAAELAATTTTSVTA
jgi:hypothetical protein